jgi:response regulator RpfG family c-di-GMP phosphodiesterase
VVHGVAAAHNDWNSPRRVLRRMQQVKVEYEMAGDTILYISDHGPRSSSILAALEATGYDVVSTDSSTQSVALLFVMHSVSVIVVDQHSIEQPSFDLAHSLRVLRPDVPIVLLCTDRIDHLPAAVDYCVNAWQALENVISDLQSIMAKKSAAAGPADCCSCVSENAVAS